MGSPGAGKTSVARQLAANLNMDHVDIDDDVLEPFWGKSVAAKVS